MTKAKAEEYDQEFKQEMQTHLGKISISFFMRCCISNFVSLYFVSGTAIIIFCKHIT